MNTGQITGRVTAAAGHPIADAVVLITGDSPSHRDLAALTDPQGGYRFDGLSPGLYTLLVNAEGRAQQTGQIFVTAGQVAELNFSFDH
jgi:hypothetical protein